MAQSNVLKHMYKVYSCFFKSCVWKKSYYFKTNVHTCVNMCSYASERNLENKKEDKKNEDIYEGKWKWPVPG